MDILPTLDYTPLSQAVSRQEKIHHKYFRFVIGTGIICILSLILTIVGGLIYGQSNVLSIGSALTFVMLLIAISVYQNITNEIRLELFTQKNNMSYEGDVPYDSRAGIIFQDGHSKIFRTLITATSQFFSEIGVYEYTTGSGKNSTTHTFSFVKIKLPRHLPNMVLDSKKNNIFGKISTLPTGFSSNQKLSLEGDFDSYFTLYAPAKYKQDALYIFTPDVMQAMIQSAKNYDCEVIDDNFYIYMNKTLNLADPKALQDILSIAGKLRTELISQTDNYTDERVGNKALNTVGDSGVRLKNRITPLKIIGIIVFSLFLLFNLAPFIFVFFSSLFGN